MRKASKPRKPYQSKLRAQCEALERQIASRDRRISDLESAGAITAAQLQQAQWDLIAAQGVAAALSAAGLATRELARSQGVVLPPVVWFGASRDEPDLKPLKPDTVAHWRLVPEADGKLVFERTSKEEPV